MPHYFEGAEARRAATIVQNALMDFLRAALNDAAGDYRPEMGRDVTVTPSEEVAAQLYGQGDGAGATGLPFVEMIAGPHKSVPELIETPGGAKRGRQHAMEFLLDMSMSDHAASREGPANHSASDRKLRDAVFSVFENGEYALHEFKVFLPPEPIRSDGDAQRQAAKRNPHVLECNFYTLDAE